MLDHLHRGAESLPEELPGFEQARADPQWRRSLQPGIDERRLPLGERGRIGQVGKDDRDRPIDDDPHLDSGHTHLSLESVILSAEGTVPARP